MKQRMPKVTVLEQSCKGVEDCGICMLVCPVSLFSPSGRMNEAGYVPPRVDDRDKCTGCGNCMIYCPDFSIVVENDPGWQALGDEKREDE